MARPKGGTAQTRGEDKRSQIVQAAMRTIVEVGYSRASTRAIAERGGFNQALIHYYFGSLNTLWLSVIDHTSAVRLQRYRAAVHEASNLEEVIDVAMAIYREDLESGQMTLISELVGASLSEPQLGRGILERMEPWVDFVESVLKGVLADSPLAAIIPTREASSALIAFYLGVNLLTRLEEDQHTTDKLFDTARNLAPVVSPLLGSFSIEGDDK